MTDMAEGSIYSTFKQDTRKFIDEINENLIKLENEGYSGDLINHIFRCIHSIKSEAAYLDFEEIKTAAHDMESAIEPLRNVGQAVEVDPALIEFCFSTIDKIEKLSSVSKSSDEAELEELSDPDEDDIAEQGIFAEKYMASGAEAPYSSFEIMLIKEARGRGEKLYSLSFFIAADEPMKYPRAYLALSNLEQEMNVIKVDPPFDVMAEQVDDGIKVILSTAQTAAKIESMLSIDQIIDIQLTQLDYGKELQNEPVHENDVREQDIQLNPQTVAHERYISVEAQEIDAISEYVTEIKKRLSDLNSVFGNGESAAAAEYELKGLETISDSIEKMMSNLQTVDFNSHFSGYKRTARDLASKLGKKVELVFNDDNPRVQRDFADFISEPILQIIRNSVVHGIETPEQRLDSGKFETGTITVTVEKGPQGLSILIADDGAGIDTASNPEKFEGIIDDQQLLELLIQPGFTTRALSEEYAGRGVGLDLVNSRIRTRSGELELVNITGRSFSLRMVFP